jgi:hypothetical protein
MALPARTTTPSRRILLAAGTAAVLALGTGGAADAPAATSKTTPTVKSVSPLKLNVGDQLTIRGTRFLRGRKKTTVIFKADGARAVFAKATISTSSLLRITVPEALTKYLALADGAPVHTRFRLRILGKRLSAAYTPAGRSPLIGLASSVTADRDCDGDGTRDRTDADDDNDLLDDALEGRLGTGTCDADSDDDGVEDGYEYKSAIDLNDDEYQHPNEALPYPGDAPYPNPLFADAAVDFDGDALPLAQEFALWKRSGQRTLFPLAYSDGLQHSIYEHCPSPTNPAACGSDDGGRRVPALRAAGYGQQADFLAWATRTGYRTVRLQPDDGLTPWWDHTRRITRDLLDVDRSGDASGGSRVTEDLYYDTDDDGWLSDDERDEDADGLTNWDETVGRMTRAYWSGCYSSEKAYYRNMAQSSLVKADSDGDGIRDGADDADGDDIPNLMELSRMNASGIDDRKAGVDCKVREPQELEDPFGNPLLDSDGNPLYDEMDGFRHPAAYGRVNPFNPCLPVILARSCPVSYNASTGAPFDGSVDWHSLQ